MSSHNQTEQNCPICLVTNPKRIHCVNQQCSFVVVTCPRCDKEQAVAAFVADHEKDCPFGSIVTVVPARFSVSRAVVQ